MAELCKTSEVAALLGYCENTVRRMYANGELPPPVSNGNRRLRWRTADIKEWIAGGCMPVSLKAHKRKTIITRRQKS